MKVEDCIVSVERRSVGGCIDLAFVFARQFILPLSTLTLCFAVPSTLLVWLLGESMRRDVLLPCTVIFAFFSTMLGGAMIAAHPGFPALSKIFHIETTIKRISAI